MLSLVSQGLEGPTSVSRCGRRFEVTDAPLECGPPDAVQDCFARQWESVEFLELRLECRKALVDLPQADRLLRSSRLNLRQYTPYVFREPWISLVPIDAWAAKSHLSFESFGLLQEPAPIVPVEPCSLPR